MEAKKNPKHDIFRYSRLNFLFSLSASIGIVLLAFNWKTEVTGDAGGTTHKNDLPDVIFLPDVKRTDHKKEVERTVKISMTKKVNPMNIVSVANNQPVSEQPETFEIEEPGLGDSTGFFSEPPPKEVADTIFQAVEQMPRPVGGVREFTETLRQNLKYPRYAKHQGIQGKVKLEFVINEKGEPVNLKIIQGIGAGCDEEAMRVIALTKWYPGKQRGRPVKVKMELPVVFQLN